MALADGRGAQRVALGAVLVLALLHAWLHASVRPLLQVSDEISYLTAIQARVVSGPADQAVAHCAAPPDGRVLDVTPGGKVLFRWAGAAGLSRLCSAGYPTAEAFWLLRLAAGLTLPLLALVTYRLARDVRPCEPAVAIGAAGIVALQPVVAGLAGGLTPDSLANLFGGLALWLATRQVVGLARWWEWPVVLAATAAALASKDTTAFLAPAVGLAFVARAWHAAATSWWGRYRGLIVAVIGVAVPAAAWLAVRIVPPTALTDPNVTIPPASDWPVLIRDGLAHVIAQLPALVETAWLPLGNFGASALALPPAFGVLPWVAAGTVAVGALALLIPPDGSRAAARATTFWLVALGLCALQPGLREAVLHLPDVYQGRWLFPVLPALATLAMVGATRLAGAWWRPLPLVLVITFATAGVGLVLLAGHHYTQFPVDLDATRLFLRSSSGAPLDETRLATWIVRPAVLRGSWPFVAAGLVWLLAGALTLAAAARLPVRLEPRHG